MDYYGVMKSKSFYITLSGLAAVAVLLLAPVFSQGQTGTDSRENAKLLQAVQEQQKTIADNQAKIDEKISAIAENVRQARIYVNRGR